MFKSHGEWKSFHIKHQFIISVFAISVSALSVFAISVFAIRVFAVSVFAVLLDNMTFFISFYFFSFQRWTNKCKGMPRLWENGKLTGCNLIIQKELGIFYHMWNRNILVWNLKIRGSSAKVWIMFIQISYQLIEYNVVCLLMISPI